MTLCISLLLSSMVAQSVNAQQQRLHLASDHDAKLLPGTGMLQLGETDAPNLLLDGNEILARDNGENSTLFLNIESGPIRTGKSSAQSDLWVTGYSRLGDDAPDIRTKLVTGTTADESIGSIEHGLLDHSKIISAYAISENFICGSAFYGHKVVLWSGPTYLALNDLIDPNTNYKLYLTYIK